jgi:SAM-dependent methyltransferase
VPQKSRSTSRREIERISRVYRAYASPARSRLYTQANPGNRAILSERVRRTHQVLRQAGFGSLEGRRILDVGCGYGHELARMLKLGARASDLVGVDLMPDRVEQARRSYPHIEFEVVDATQLSFADSSFDLVLSFTVLSSILDLAVAKQMGSEMSRVLRPGGAVLWYDMRFSNPANGSVRGLSAHDIRGLFPQLQPSLHAVTLVPPLARRLGPLTTAAYLVLSSVPLLRTHLLGLLVKPASMA